MIIKKTYGKLGKVAHAYNLNLLTASVGEQRAPGWPGLHNPVKKGKRKREEGRGSKRWKEEGRKKGS